jgi:hypothetical protein
MSEIIRGRDCIVLFKSDSYAVAVDSAMVAGGWPGGQGVQWVESPTSDIRMVTYSRGLYGGVLIWGSDERADDYTALMHNQLQYRFATFIGGGNLIATTSYERYTYASRIGGGPFVPIVYKPSQFLYLSLRGLWTNEDEPTQAGVGYSAFFTGMVAQLPKSINNYYLGIQTSF